MPKLIALQGTDAGEAYELTQPETVLGRFLDCDVVLNSDTVSRRHARLICQGDAVYVEDLNSLNGTFINDQRISGRTRLRDQDVLQLSKVELRFQADQPAPHLQPQRSGDSSESEFPIRHTILASLDMSQAELHAAANPQEKLRAMIEITRSLENSLASDEVLAKILAGLFKVFPRADRAYILMIEGPAGELRLRAIQHRHDETGESITTRLVSRSIASKVLREGKAILSVDVAADQQLSSHSVIESNIHSVMCAPLKGPSHQPLGVIHVDTRDPAHKFTQEDLEVLVSVATLAGQAVEYSRVHEAHLQSARLAAIGQMVTGLAHESRNALQRSQACLERLGYRVQDRPEAVELIARIQDAQDQLHQLYEQVRRYAAPIVLNRQLHDVGKMWQRAWEHLEPQRAGRQVEVRWRQPEGLELQCRIDPLAIERVFSNLVDNAIAACSDPVELEVQWLEGEIHGQPALRIVIRDNGPGMTLDQRQKMFEPFYTTKTNGTGLGLAITKRMVEAHGGWIELLDSAQPGTTFQILLPR